MKKYYFLLFFPFLQVFCFGQQSKIDSLWAEFNNSNVDTTKASILSDIVVNLYALDFTQTQKVNDCLISFSKGRSDKYLAQGYRTRGTLNLLDGNYQQALENYNLSLEIFKSIDYKKGEANVLENLGTLYGRSGDEDKAIEYYSLSIKLNEDNNNQKGTIRAYLNIAITYSKMQMLTTSNEYLIKAIEVSEITNHPNDLKNINNFLAINYLKLDQFEKAEAYLKKALNLAENDQDNYTLGSIYNSFGYLYETCCDDYEKALENYQKSLQHYNLINNKHGIINAHYNVALQKLRFEDYNEALFYTKTGLELSQESDYTVGIGIGNLHLVHIFIQKNDFESAQKYFLMAKKITDKTGEKDFKNHYYRISEAFANKSKYVEAYENMRIYAHLADSLFKENSVYNLAEIETKYQTEKKERENVQLKQETAENLLKLEKQARQNLWLWFVAMISLLIVTVIFLISKNHRNRLIYNMHLKIIQEKENEQQRIADILHDDKAKTLEQIAVSLEKQGDNTTASQIHQIRDGIRELSHELSRVPFIESEFDQQVFTLASNYHTATTQIHIEGLNIINWNNISDSVKRNLFSVIKEALSNAYAHAKAQNVWLVFSKKSKNLTVTITDDGIGISNNSGKGITNMKMKIDEIKGKITFDSVKNKGTTIGVYLTLF